MSVNIDEDRRRCRTLEDARMDGTRASWSGSGDRERRPARQRAGWRFFREGTVARASIPKSVQARVFERDGWTCQHCGRPVVFAPALRAMEFLAASMGRFAKRCWHHSSWRRDRAPLLHELGAEVGVRGDATGAVSDVSACLTSCRACRMRDGMEDPIEYARRTAPQRPRVPGPGTAWDGFSTLFLRVAARHPGWASPAERGWVEALEGARVTETKRRRRGQAGTGRASAAGRGGSPPVAP